MKPQTRKYIYTIVIAIVPLLVTLGYLTDPLGQQILNVVGAILSVGAAAIAHKNVQ